MPRCVHMGRPGANTRRAREALSRLRHKLARFVRRASTTRDPIEPSLPCAFSCRGDGNPGSAQRQGVCSWISLTYVATVTPHHEVCNRLEELIYGDVSHSKNDAPEIIQAEASEGVWPHEEAELLSKLLAS